MWWAGNCINNVAASKLLDFDLEKSGFIVIRGKKRRLELTKKINKMPSHLSGNWMKQMNICKYLGD